LLMGKWIMPVKVLEFLSLKAWFNSDEDAKDAKTRFSSSARNEWLQNDVSFRSIPTRIGTKNLSTQDREHIADIVSKWNKEFKKDGRLPTVRHIQSYVKNKNNTIKECKLGYSDWMQLFKARPDLGRKARRRMAQREFSDRRDSPVMTRLLEEIIAAQDPQDD